MVAGNRLDELKAYVQAKGWRWKPGADIPYGEQITVSDVDLIAVVNFWPKRGKMNVQGPDSPLKTALQAWLAEQESAAPDAASRMIPLPHLGLDESGKGDWFGPLVVAAVYLDEGIGARLRKLGVQDSKALASADIRRLAVQIERLVPAAQCYVWAIEPETYNRLYAEHNNLNRLLAEAYAHVAEKVWRATQTATIVCDQFSQRTDRLANAFAGRGLPDPIQRHHAESASVAVAAASILANAAFSDALNQLGRTTGLSGPLPKGSAAEKELTAAVKHILRRQGQVALGRYAKLNFKPVRQLLAWHEFDQR